MTNIALHDGRIIDNRNFEIHDNEYRRLTATDKWAMRWAYELLAQAPPCSAVIATRHGVVGYCFGAPTNQEACLRAAAETHRKGLRLPKRGVAGTVNFPITLDNALALGVDSLFLPERIFANEDRALDEMSFLKAWLGPNHHKDDEYRIERRVIAQTKWKAKSWE